jgi:hypothetical protein
MCFEFQWVVLSRKICANFVQSKWLVQMLCKPKITPAFVQKCANPNGEKGEALAGSNHPAARY